jgi:AbrB family looped-hinge helix DNA binding protein
MEAVKVKVLPKGQVTLPKKIRGLLGIREGDALMVFRRGEEVVLRKRKTLFDMTGSLPDVGLSPEKMIEEALEKAVREREEEDLR